MSSSSSARGYRYAPVGRDKDAQPSTPSPHPWWRIHAIYGVVILLVAIVSFYSGQDTCAAGAGGSMLKKLDCEIGTNLPT
jgi:hypothetical protein